MLKKYDRFELSVKNVASQLGRQPSEIEYKLLKYFGYSRYLCHPIPELRNIFSENNESHLTTDSRSFIVGNESKKSIIKTSSLRTQHAFGLTPVLRYQSSQSAISIGLIDDGKTWNYPIHGNESLLFIQDGPNMKKVCSEINKVEGVSIFIVNPASLGNVLLDLLKNTFGLDLSFENIDDAEILSNHKTCGMLCVGKQDLLTQLKTIVDAQDLKGQMIGQLKSAQFISLIINHNIKASISLPQFYPAESPIQTLTPIINKPEKQRAGKVQKDLKNYSNHALTIWKKVSQQKYNNLKPEKYAFGTIAVYHRNNDNIAIAIPDNLHLIKNHIKSGSRILVANACRQLVNKGYKPIGVTMIMHGRDLRNNDEQWELQQLYSGVKESCQYLNMKLVNPLITSDKTQADLEVCVIGEKIVNEHSVDESFQNENDFITMLGSHRGELNGSLYQKDIQKSSVESIPSVDLRMESRLQEVILQGIQTQLIKSVSNISTGGLVVAIIKSLNQSKNELGARIHLSRKLRQDEILFGETQGLVVVSINESDLMEFERICMTIGVPSTTIGRVTRDGRLKFNDVVNIHRKEL